MNSLVRFYFLAVIILVPSQYSFAGGDIGNGGDPLVSRIKLIERYISTRLRKDADDYISNVIWEHIQIPFGPGREALKKLLARGISDDIKVSGYFVRSSCKNFGGQHAGGSIANDLYGKICLSPKRLAQVNASKSEIVALLIHEHAHHYGFDDANYEIYNTVYQTVKLTEPNWSYSEKVPVLSLRRAEVPSKGSAEKKVPNLNPIEKRADGSILLLSQEDAENHCRQQGSRLPTAYELAVYAQSQGAKGIRETQYKDLLSGSKEVIEENSRMRKDGYFPIFHAIDLNKYVVDFYFNKAGYIPTYKELGHSHIWSSSISYIGMKLINVPTVDGLKSEPDTELETNYYKLGTKGYVGDYMMSKESTLGVRCVKRPD